MTVRFSVLPEANPAWAADKKTIQDTGAKMITAVHTALGRINAAGFATDAQFQRCFCAAAQAGQANAVRTTVRTILSAMDNFLSNTSNTVTIKTKAVRAEAGDYAYVYPDLGRVGDVGQWFIYLGPQFNSTPLPGSGVRDVRLLTLAHELSHHFGTNAVTPYKTEHYDGAGLALTTSNPPYAANNADNYGYFIEAVAP